MALLSRADVVEMCGIKNAAISVNVKREKLKFTGDHIDDNIEPNKSTLEKWKRNHEAKLARFVTDMVSQPAAAEKQEHQRRRKQAKNEELAPPPTEGQIVPDEPKVEQGTSLDSSFDLDQKKKIAEIAYKIEMTTSQRLKQQKLRGENIPTNLVLSLVALLAHSFQSSYKNGVDVLLIELVTELKITPAQEAKFKGLIVKIINTSHKDALSEARKTIKNIASSYVDPDADED